MTDIATQLEDAAHAFARGDDASMDLLTTAVRRLRELEQEEDFNYLLQGRMGKILNDTANALKGPPDELALHSTHDLAEVAARLVREKNEAVNTMTSYYDRIQKLEAANKALMHQANVANARIDPLATTK